MKKVITMKRIFYLFVFLLLVGQPIVAKKGSRDSAGPAVTASPSKWFSWFKSLRTPNRQDVRRARAYVNRKWRCLRHGENCSKKERALLGLLAAATAALVGKGVHALVTPSDKTSIRNIISVEDIQRIARPYESGLITFSDGESFWTPEGDATHGAEARSPSYMSSRMSKGFASADEQDKLYAGFFKTEAFVATYMIKHKKSGGYIKAQIGYSTKDQADNFIQQMDLYVFEKLGFNSEYDIGKSVDKRFFL